MKKRQRKSTIQGRRFARTFVSTALALLLAGSGPEVAPMAKAANTASLQNPRVSEVQGGEQDAASGLRNPRVKMRIRDTITFGSYWQEDTNGDGVADQDDDKQPIRWQVLSVDGDDVFLLADKVLDCQPYNTEYGSVTWEACSLRTWLNEDFYNTAFSDTEKEAIKETTVTNADNPVYDTEGGTDTKDKVYQLSLSEVSDPAYGFHGEMRYGDEARIGKATSYVEAKGVWQNKEKGIKWWLRSPGEDDTYAACVDDDGYANPHGEGGYFMNDVRCTSISGVRPALHLNLSSFSPEKIGSEETAMEDSEWDMVELGTWQGKPLQWRVLSVKDGDVFLLADRIITDKAYHETEESVAWEGSFLRGWLNGDFYQNTFSVDEKKGIRNVMWENKDNPWYGTEGGEDTIDPVSLLSLADILEKEYGFSTSYYCDSKMRIAVDGRKEGSFWWLRSPSYNDNLAAYVSYSCRSSLLGDGLKYSHMGVRPVLHFNLSSSSLTKVGTVTAKEDYLTGGTSSGVTYDPPGLSGEFDTEPEQPSKPSDPSGGGSTGSDQPSSPSTPSGGSSSGTPSGSQGQTGNGGASGGSVTQGQGSTGSQNGTQAGAKTDTKPGRVTSLKAKNNKKKAVTLSWKKVPKAKKYQIQYSQNKKFKKAKTKTAKKVSGTVTKLMKGKTFYFRVRAVSADGKKGTWSKIVKVKVKK